MQIGHSVIAHLFWLLLLTQSISFASATANNTDFQDIEHALNVKLGIFALDTNNHEIIAYRTNERFPFQSTFKLMGVSALLYQDDRTPLLNKKILITPQMMVPWHPITGKYLNQRLTLNKLAKSAISYSDNPAINQIIHALGGIKSINQFAHQIGNKTFVLTHLENELNSNPDKNADTVTPKDMAYSVKALLLGHILSQHNHQRLMAWMKNNTTGQHRIRAGVPKGWLVADKTGSGRYGVANDIGITWSATCKPIVLSIYSVSSHPAAKPNSAAIRLATRVIFKKLAQANSCLKNIS